MGTISLAHGNGGRMTETLINELFLKYFNNDILEQKDDSSLLPEINGKPVWNNRRTWANYFKGTKKNEF